jgi:hypothetical protein
MIVLRWFGRLALLALGLILAGNVVAPAVARAQFVASGGASVAEVLAALVGQDLSAKTLTLTATAGPAVVCNSTMAGGCIDLGPGAHNAIGTNASGHVLIGPENDPSTVVRLGDKWTMYGNGTLLGTGAAIVLNNGGFLVNQTGTEPVNVDDSHGFRKVCYASLPTCGTQVPEGTQVTVCASGSARTKECECTSDGAGTPTYAWAHLGTWAIGDPTTCAP